ncbi:MAG: oxidoreductase [Clostridiales bacterium]|nr:oxidoreductase [Clostridiales bacterium]
MERFPAFMMDERYQVGWKEITDEDLPPGDVTIRVKWSSINYKDGLATRKESRVVRKVPTILGIDLAGKVVESSDPELPPGLEVIATGYDLGTGGPGGYTQRVRLPREWVLPLPRGLSLREAMILGTAGFTAALAIHRMEQNGLRPDGGPVLVTGASGGVGSLAVDMLAGLGYTVEASSGDPEAEGYLRRLGAAQILPREEVTRPQRPLESGRWQGAIDPVGGPVLPSILPRIRPGGSVGLMGNRGGAEFTTTVFPFILRGVSLLGIDSAYCPRPLREEVWSRLGKDLKPRHLELLVTRELSRDELEEGLQTILEGKIRGRWIVRLD